MKGTHSVLVYNKKIRYAFEIHRNITIIRGDSATGKTQLLSMIETRQRQGRSSGIEVVCRKPCIVIYADDWKQRIREGQECIFFIEEGQDFVSTKEFAELVKASDSYFVIVTRQNLPNLPYSVEEIYGIRESGKYKGLKQVYNELYHLYGFHDSALERADGQGGLPGDILEILTEDMNSGFQFFQSVSRDDAIVLSAGGKSNVPIILKEKSLRQDSDNGVLVIADGAAFGSEMESVVKLMETGANLLLYLPESFEWLLLSSGFLKDQTVQTVLENPSDYIESRDFFSWERFFTSCSRKRQTARFTVTPNPG